jgi:hypothetical protein
MRTSRHAVLRRSATSARRVGDPRRPKRAKTSRKLNRAARVVVEPSRVLIPAPASTRAVAVRPELQRDQQMPMNVTPELVAPISI